MSIREFSISPIKFVYRKNCECYMTILPVNINGWEKGLLTVGTIDDRIMAELLYIDVF